MKKTSGFVGLLLLSLYFVQCHRELSYYGAPDNTASLPTPDPITATVQGNVFDENGQPAMGVAVQAGNNSSVTDAKGYFRITEASLDKKASLVTATKQGYFKAYRTFSATSGTNQVVIKLIKKALVGSVPAASGGEVALSNGSKIVLPANGIVTASTNDPYTGTINVYASYINPTSPDINQIVPGSFLATNKDGKRVMLASYGMVAVELESSSGEKLQIKSGATATLTTAIPSAVQNTAPATIALWSVDETTGVWKEEGTATKNGNVYTGEVKHFSFWNCDVPMNAVVLSLTLKNSENNPLVNVGVRIKRTTENGVSYRDGYTDSLGQVSGYVPSNEPLELEVLDECGAAFYSQSISSLSQSTNLGVITVTNTGSSVVTLKGKLMDCSSAVVTDGFAIITFDNRVRYAAVNANGEFQTTLTRCNNSSPTVDIVGVDHLAQQQGDVTSIGLNVPLTNAGNIMACGTSAVQFINYTLDGVDYTLSSTTIGDSLTAYTYTTQNGASKNTTFFRGGNRQQYNAFSLWFEHGALANGTYQAKGVDVKDYLGVPKSPFDVIVTNFPQAVGGFYQGSFNGNFSDSSNTTTHTLSGTFRLRRIY